VTESVAPTPHPDLKIISSRVFRGPNIWHYEPAIQLVVDLGVLEDFPTNKIPGFADALLERLPGLMNHTCSRGRRGSRIAKRCRNIEPAAPRRALPRPSPTPRSVVSAPDSLSNSVRSSVTFAAGRGKYRFGPSRRRSSISEPAAGVVGMSAIRRRWSAGRHLHGSFPQWSWERSH